MKEKQDYWINRIYDFTKNIENKEQASSNRIVRIIIHIGIKIGLNSTDVSEKIEDINNRNNKCKFISNKDNNKYPSYFIKKDMENNDNIGIITIKNAIVSVFDNIHYHFDE